MKKLFEILAEDWGHTNTIHYFVTGHTQTTKGLFTTKDELMEVFRGIADDYFSSTPRNAGALSDEEKKKLEED